MQDGKSAARCLGCASVFLFGCRRQRGRLALLFLRVVLELRQRIEDSMSQEDSMFKSYHMSSDRVGTLV